MGTARKTPILDVLDLLESQHSEVDALFEALEAKRGDRAEVFAELADKLAAHATIEEKIFYPAAMTSATEDMLRESVEEHLAMKRVIADMLEIDDEDDEFDAKLAVLKEQVSHHAHEEEEAKLFAMLRRTMSEDDRAALGNECMAMFEQLITQEPRFEVPSQTSEAAPLPAPQ